MNRHVGLVLGLCLALFGGAGAVSAESASNLFSFANALFAEKDYYRAITEYKRVAHEFEGTAEARAARYAIGLAYFRGEKWDAAMAAFRDIRAADPDSDGGADALLMMGESAYRAGDYATALDLFESFARNYSDDPRTVDARMRIAQCHFSLGQYSLAGKQSAALAADYPKEERAAVLSGEMRSIEQIPMKSPALAGTLSAVLPGAGQLYTGRPRDAGISFLLNGGLIAAAVIAFEQEEPVAGGLLSLVELTWYSGNVYGAVNAAHKNNRTQRSRFLERLDFQCGIMTDSEHRVMPCGGLSVRF